MKLFGTRNNNGSLREHRSASSSLKLDYSPEARNILCSPCFAIVPIITCNTMSNGYSQTDAKVVISSYKRTISFRSGPLAALGVVHHEKP